MSAVSLNNQILYLDVTVDDNRITDISIDSRDEIIKDKSLIYSNTIILIRYICKFIIRSLILHK